MSKSGLSGSAELLQRLSVREERSEGFNELLRELLAQLLELLPAGSKLGERLLMAIGQQVPMVAHEALVFRHIQDWDCVFLSVRPEGEAYGGLLHHPGTQSWGEDKAQIQPALNRLAVREFHLEAGDLYLLKDQPVWVEGRPKTERWPEWNFTWLCGLKGDPPPEAGGWYSVDDVLKMPDDEIIPEHRRGIGRAYGVWLLDLETCL